MERATFIPNSFQVPNAFVDDFMAFLTPPEIAVLMYACRRIFGFGKRQDRISLSQFSSGIVTRDGKRLDHGTGLDQRTVSKALKNLIRAGLIVQVEAARQDQTPALYALQLEPALVDFQWLMERRAARGRLNAERTQKARSGKSGTGTSDAPVENADNWCTPCTSTGTSDNAVLVHPTTPTIKRETKRKTDRAFAEESDYSSNDDHAEIEDQSSSSFSNLFGDDPFVQELSAVDLQGQLTAKELDHFQRQAAEHGEEKVLAYLRWCAAQGWNWGKAYAVDRKHQKIHDWELPESEAEDDGNTQPAYRVEWVTDGQRVTAARVIFEDGYTYEVKINEDRRSEVHIEGEWLRIPRIGQVEYFYNGNEEMRREFTADGWQIRPVQDGDIKFEKRQIFREGRWWSVPADGEVCFTGEVTRHGQFMIRGGTFALNEFSVWVGDFDGHYRPATVEEARRFCAERAARIGRPIILAEAEPEAQP